MSAINVTSVQVLDNPLFANPLQFEIQYECLQDLRHGAWRRRRRGRAVGGWRRRRMTAGTKNREA